MKIAENQPGQQEHRAATDAEIEAMRGQLEEALKGGALGLSSGLAYLSANAATTAEVVALARPLGAAGAVYTTHMRSETEKILDAMREAFEIGRVSRVPVIVSHLKCAGIANGDAAAKFSRRSRRRSGRNRRAAIAIPTRRVRVRSICGRWMNA